MPISVVNDIVMLQPITLVPQSHIFIEGVINLRGTIMPAINLRKMMGLSRATVTPATRMIIIAHEETPLALLVDGITYVISLWATEIDDQSLPSRSLGADFIARISKGRDRIVGIIDPSKILFQMIDSDVLEESKKKNENE
jgi:purine-binding chemotaxis protein CheW